MRTPVDPVVEHHQTQGWLAVAGAAFWAVGAVAIQPDPFATIWAHWLLLFAPLVLLPLAIALIEPAASYGPVATSVWRLIRHAQLPAALLLMLSFRLPQGWSAAGLAVPWLAVDGLLAILGVLRFQKRGWRPVPDLCLDFGLLYAAIGGVWAVLSRFGARPLNFEDVIVLLTAIHFHYAGLLLPLLTSLVGRRGGRIANLASVLVIVGVPAVATGITATQLGASPVFEALAAWTMASGGLLVAFQHNELALGSQRIIRSRLLFGLTGLSLAVGMVFAILYGGRGVWSVARLSIPWMRVLHGTTIVFGCGLAGLLGWYLDSCPSPQVERNRRVRR
jgi:hypothetical protein